MSSGQHSSMSRSMQPGQHVSSRMSHSRGDSSQESSIINGNSDFSIEYRDQILKQTDDQFVQDISTFYMPMCKSLDSIFNKIFFFQIDPLVKPNNSLRVFRRENSNLGLAWGFYYFIYYQLRRKQSSSSSSSRAHPPSQALMQQAAQVRIFK